jgi:hypothetical protein
VFSGGDNDAHVGDDVSDTTALMTNENIIRDRILILNRLKRF